MDDYTVSCVVGDTWEWLLEFPQDVRDSDHLPDVVNEHAGAVMNEHARLSIIASVRHRDNLDLRR
jgi:hypothetical protein